MNNVGESLLGGGVERDRAVRLAVEVLPNSADVYKRDFAGVAARVEQARAKSEICLDERVDVFGLVLGNEVCGQVKTNVRGKVMQRRQSMLEYRRCQ